jgi:hypothetical protein
MTIVCTSPKKKLTAAERKARERAAADRACQQGRHALTATLRAGEQLCAYCGVIFYCPACLQAHHFAPSKSAKAYALECSEHRKAEVQA